MLTTAVLIGPLVATVVASFTVGRGGLGNYSAVFHDPAIRHAIGDSLRWLAFAPLVCLAGLAVAWPTRRQRRPLIGLLAAPVAVSALVTGAAFRLLATGVDPALLGSGWIWVVLGLAFVWQWLGLTAVVFRASMTGIPRDLLRVARAFGAGRLRQAGAVMLPALFPAGALVLILVLVTAARVFELVLAVAPGSVQDQVDVVGVHLWRFGPVLGTGESAALAVLLFLLVAAVALAGLGGLRREWPTVRDPAPSSRADLVPEPRVAWPAWSRRLTRPAAVLVGIVWLVPLAALVLTSLHTPRAAAGGLLVGRGLGLGLLPGGVRGRAAAAHARGHRGAGAVRRRPAAGAGGTGRVRAGPG